MRERAVVILPERQGVLGPTTTRSRSRFLDCGSFQRGALVLMLLIPVNSKRSEHTGKSQSRAFSALALASQDCANSFRHNAFFARE